MAHEPLLHRCHVFFCFFFLFRVHYTLCIFFFLRLRNVPFLHVNGSVLCLFMDIFIYIYLYKKKKSYATRIYEGFLYLCEWIEENMCSQDTFYRLGGEKNSHKMLMFMGFETPEVVIILYLCMHFLLLTQCTSCMTQEVWWCFFFLLFWRLRAESVKGSHLSTDALRPTHCVTMDTEGNIMSFCIITDTYFAFIKWHHQLKHC